MNKIKTREVVKDIKVFSRTKEITTHMINTFIHSRAQAEHTQDSGYNSPSEYAFDHVTNSSSDMAKQASRNLKNPHKKAFDNINKSKQNFQKVKQQTYKERKSTAKQAKEAAQKAKNNAEQIKKKADQARRTAQEAKKAVQDAKQVAQQIKQTGRQTVKTSRLAEKGVKQSEKAIKTTGKGTVKSIQKSIKTSEQTAKTAVKTAQKTAKMAQKSARTRAKAAKASAQASRAAAKAATAASKAATKGVIATIKATIAAVKSLISIIAAGGWVVVIIIVVICMIALFASSVYGIFFSNENPSEMNGKGITEVIENLNTEYYDKLEKIKTDNPHDTIEIISSNSLVGIKWNEVLAVYAVKVVTDSDDAVEVATIDDSKVEILRAIMWDMNDFTYSIAAVIKEENGNETSPSETMSETVLTITINHKSYLDMATAYSFNSEQKSQLNELMSDEYKDLWSQLIDN